MSDRRLRELEGRYHETGSLDDEVALLAERLRVGAIERARLEVACHARHPAALLALGAPEPGPLPSLADWATALTPYGREYELLVAFASARAALAHASAAEGVDPWVREQGCQLAEAALAAAEAVMREPGPETTRRCEETSAAATFAWEGSPLYEHHPFVIEALGLEAMGRVSHTTGRHFPLSAYRLQLILGHERAFAVLARAVVGYALRATSSRRPAAPEVAGVSANGARRIYRILSRLAASDGFIHPAEQQVLDQASAQLGIPSEEARTLGREALREARIEIGDKPAERALLLRLMLDVAVADGHLHTAELRRLRKVADAIGFPEADLAARLRARFPGGE